MKMNRKQSIYVLAIAIGIFCRFIAMTVGHNYDFDSYCIVGEIAGNFRNVYAETGRYNYGPIFFCIQGLLYKIAQIKDGSWELTYRVLMVSVLTLADLGIAEFIGRKYSLMKALIFFLNPVSIIITGFHNQFDNIAILLALLATLFYNEDEEIGKKDISFVILFTLCLMTKHILFLLPLFLLLRKGLTFKKKVLYACVPPFLFLLSFVPFAVTNKAAFQGILKNVFLYRSTNNAPLLNWFYNLIGFPSGLKFIVFAILMLVVAVVTRKESFERQLYIYLISMVAFSSAIANQYLVIPLVALCVLNVGVFRYLYMIVVGGYLMLQGEGFGALDRVQAIFPGMIGNLAGIYVKNGYVLATWILFLALLYELVIKNKRKCANRNEIHEDKTDE